MSQSKNFEKDQYRSKSHSNSIVYDRDVKSRIIVGVSGPTRHRLCCFQDSLRLHQRRKTPNERLLTDSLIRVASHAQFMALLAASIFGLTINLVDTSTLEKGLSLYTNLSDIKTQIGTIWKSMKYVAFLVSANKITLLGLDQAYLVRTKREYPVRSCIGPIGALCSASGSGRNSGPDGEL
jgi:hypothetical protein